MKLSIIGAAAIVALSSRRADAQGMYNLRAGVDARMARPAATTFAPMAASPSQNGVSRKSLAIGAGVGALIGGVAGGLAVNNSKFSKNEAAGLFILMGAGIGGVVGAGLGMAVVAFALP